MVVLELPEWPELAVPDAVMIVTIPIDARVAYTNARRLLQQLYLYNAPGTTFQRVQTFWFDSQLNRWQPFETQQLRSSLFKVLVPVSGLLLATNAYKLQMAVFGVPQVGGFQMLPEDHDSDTQNATFSPQQPIASSSTVPRLPVTTTQQQQQTTSLNGAATPAPPPPFRRGSLQDGDTVAIGAGVGAGVLVLIVACLVYECRRKYRQRKPEVTNDEAKSADGSLFAGMIPSARPAFVAKQKKV
jgi:hypothetical protein